MIFMLLTAPLMLLSMMGLYLLVKIVASVLGVDKLP